jgi:O-succinylbenzoate synthase
MLDIQRIVPREIRLPLREPFRISSAVVSERRKPGRVGGFTASKAIHDVCERSGVPVWCGGMLESGIGRARNVALASLPNFTLPGDLSPSARYWSRDIVTPAWTMDADGMVRVPVELPGIGVTVDVNRVDDLTVRQRTIAAGLGGAVS